MAGNPYIGRRESIGVGIETVPGTGIAPQAWQRHLALTLDPKTTVVQNKSAMGRIEDINDSAVTEEWVEGSINGKVTDLTIGYFLANIFGSVAPALHPTETTVYDNTFSVSSSAIPPSLTFARVSPVRSRRFAMGTLTDLEIDIKQNDWIQITATVTAKSGVTSTETVAYANENEFTSKHAVTKIAANIAGLTGATALQIKSLKLKISRKAERFTPVGVIDPISFDPNSWGVTGTIVTRYTDTTLEDIAFLNTSQALSIAIVNTDVTIGTASNPGLVLTAPKVRFSPMTLDNKLDQTLSSTYNFTCELDLISGYMLKAILTNTQNGYAHA
ncbi:phage tail tube protein [Cryobacterium sp. GrIS_2_6]|uniref:phage tail tube protein n=1 Tax=Cryobacterium sp. GrIS_2_6 TaxID=3162785 RepID=UPI002E05F98A|nr:hypothetical protein [Cryobacterium psychrotolerans]